MRAWILVQFFVFVAFSAVNSVSRNGEHHVVYMPTTARKDSNYTIFFLSIDTVLPTNVTIYVNNIMKNFHIVEPGHPTLLKTHILRIGVSIVKLVAKGGSTFVKQTKVHTVGGRNKAALFVQKSTFRVEPGKILGFNCFALDSEFMVINKPIDIEVYDSKQILMQKWNGLTGHLGVVTKYLLISKDASPGFWKLVLRQNHTKLVEAEHFLVKSIEPSRATVNISGPTIVFSLGLPPQQYAQQTVELVIRASYQCSLPMVGRLYITCHTDTNQLIRMNTPFNGTYVYRFRLDILLQPNYKARRFEFHAVVTDRKTKFYTVSEPHIIGFGRYPVKVFRPYIMVQKEGLYQTLALAVRPTMKMKYLSASESQGSLNVTFVNRHTKMWSVHCATLVGDVIVPIPLSHLNTIVVQYSSHYQQFHYTVTSLIKVHQFTPGYPQMEVSICSQNYYAGDTIHIQINATVKIQAVYYMVMHEGCPISAGRVFVYGDRVIVGIKTDMSWNPFVRIIFTAVTYTEYTLVNGILVSLMPTFAYKVQANFSTNIIQSGDEGIIIYSSEQHSTLYTVSNTDILGKLDNRFISMKMIIAKLYKWYFPTCAPIYINVRSVFVYARLDYSTNMFSVARLISGHYYPCYYNYLRVNDMKPINRRDPFRNLWFWRTVNFRISDTQRTYVSGESNEANYYVHAFAVHETKGLSVMEKKPPIKNVPKIWQCFAAPTSVFIGEQFDIIVTLYSYLPYNMLVNVKVTNPEIICNGSNIKTIMVPCKTYVYVTFSICMRQYGTRGIYTQLYSGSKIFDFYGRKVYARPHGYTVYKTNEKRYNLKKKTFRMPMPVATEPVVPKSEETYIYYAGDIMASIIFYAPRIVLLPTDSCEQRISKLSFAIFTSQYLEFRKVIPYQWRLSTVKILGYQDVQKCRNDDGTYGEKSVWETFMACRIIYQASLGKYAIDIDQKKLVVSLNWLISKQLADGSYAESGPIIHTMIQRKGGKTSIPLTICALLTLTELKHLQPVQAKRAIFKGVHFLRRNRPIKRWDTFSLAYLIHLSGKLKDVFTFRTTYKTLSKRATRSGNMLYWKGAYGVEQTCHILLGMYYMKKKIRGWKIFNYLLSKRNMRGGFGNTQSTTVCVEAFSKFAQYLIRVSNAQIKATVKNTHVTTYNYKDGKYPLRLYIKRFTSGSVGVKTKSAVFTNKIWKEKKQFAVVRLVRLYNTLKKMNDNFGLVTTVKVNKGYHLNIVLCYRWTKKYVSGLLLTRLQLPTGYIKKAASCGKPICNKHGICKPNTNCIANIVGKEKRVSIYLKSMSRNMSFCIVVATSKFYTVKNRNHKMYVETTQYYTDKKVVLFYRV